MFRSSMGKTLDEKPLADGSSVVLTEVQSSSWGQSSRKIVAQRVNGAGQPIGPTQRVPHGAISEELRLVVLSEQDRVQVVDGETGRVVHEFAWN